MDEMRNIGGAGMRPVFVDKQTGYLLTFDPASGRHVPVLGSDTRKPIKNRMVYVDALTGCYAAIDMKTGDVTDVIDPATGKPMLAAWPKGEPEEEPAEKAEAANSEAETDEQALAQADSDDGDAWDAGPSRRDGEPSLMELMQQMEEEAAAAKAADSEDGVGIAPAPAIAPADTDDALPHATPRKQPDYLQMLPHIDTRDTARADGASIAVLVVVAAVIVFVLIGQMMYWALY